jgi:hypothetical protein
MWCSIKYAKIKKNVSKIMFHVNLPNSVIDLNKL